MKRLLLALSILPCISATGMEVIPCSSKEEGLRLLHDTRKQRVYVEDENAAYRIENFDMNPMMRKLIERSAVAKFTDKDGYVRVNKIEDPAQLSKYALAAKVRGDGGGAGGAWAGVVLGKFLVHFVAQAGIGIATAGVAIVCPPAAPAFFYAAEVAIAPTVEAASNVVAIGTGILGAVATGPV